MKQAIRRGVCSPSRQVLRTSYSRAFSTSSVIASRSISSYCSKTSIYSSSSASSLSWRLTRPSTILLSHNTPSSSLKRFYADKVIAVPPMGDSITEGVVLEWAKNAGDSVAVDDLVITLETDKVSVPIRSDVAGTIAETYANIGDSVKVGQKLFKVAEGAVAAAPAKPKEPEKTAAATPPPAQKATPPAAEKPAPPQPAAAAKAPTPAAAPSPAPKAAAPPSGSREIHRVKAPRIRVRTAERLKDAQNTYAMLTTFQECDMSNLMALRDEFKDAFQEKHGVKLGFMSCFVKASANALKESPVINAVLSGEEIIYRDFVDISVAVATPKGLVVPVLKDCDLLSWADIEKKIVEYGKKAKDGSITLEEMTGGTFTISNGGVYGSMMGTPIVNPPQSAILGMHAITKRPVVVKDKIEIRPMMYLALTYDHRLIDGKDAVTFLRKIKMGVEDPRRMLLDL